MPDRWYYTRRLLPRGPVTDEQLKQLAATDKLAPNDLVWREGVDPRHAVQAQSLLSAASFRSGGVSAGDWLGKVAQVLATTPSGSNSSPDWLSEVEPESVGEPIPTPSPATEALVELVPVGPSVVPYPPRLILGGASSRGRERVHNEDRYQTRHWNWNDAEGTHEVAFIVVADGMGGYQAGDVAARLTVRTVAGHLSQVVDAAINGRRADGAALASAVTDALHEANHVVHARSNAEEQCKGMGATAAAVVVWDGLAFLAHVGDCRVYLHREGILTQLTEDQTLVARMVAMGTLTAEEAAQHESRNEVTQAIGKRPAIEPSQANRTLERGDYLLVACDGLAAHVETPTIRDTLNGPPLPDQHLAAHFVQMADDGGGSDNCTVIVAYFG